MTAVKKNAFSSALKSSTPAQATRTKSKSAVVQSAHSRPSRDNTKHIGGYFDPKVSKQLRSIALDEDSSVQVLLEEAIDMLFQSRKKPTIARR